MEMSPGLGVATLPCRSGLYEAYQWPMNGPEVLMAFTSFCPRCDNELTQHDHVTGFAICKCGWFDTTSSKQSEEKGEKKAMIMLAGAAIAFVLGYGHMLSWGAYAVQIPVVKIQQLTGTLSASGYTELAENCIALNKWSCAKEAYRELFQKTRDVKALASLAYLQARLGESSNALSTYEVYIQSGGKDGEALLRYAHILEDAGQTDLAMKTYESAITARPDVLPVQATGAIVRMLIKQGKMEEAFNRLTEFRASAGNAKGYLNTEYSAVESALNAKKPGHIAKGKHEA